MLRELFAGTSGQFTFLFSLIGLLLAVTVHEFAHAASAEKLGDKTAQMMGRVSLNPLSHLDPWGTLFLLLSGFGWGKPVPVNPLNFENPLRDSALVSLAGPFANLSLAFLLSLPFRLNWELNTFWLALLVTVIGLNVALAVFNLLPIFPLDGFKVVSGALPPDFSLAWEKTAPYGIFLLLFFVFLPLGGFSLIDIFVQPLYRTILGLLLGS